MVVDLLPPGARCFKQVLGQFQTRMSRMLSNPNLAKQALEEVEAEAAAATAAAQQEQEERAAAAPRRGLFACFSRPFVLEQGPGGSHSERSARGGMARDCSARSGRREFSARSGAAPADFSARSGRDFSARSGRDPAHSLRGGSEHSMKGGVVRDPSVRGCRRAASVEVRAARSIGTGCFCLWQLEWQVRCSTLQAARSL